MYNNNPSYGGFLYSSGSHKSNPKACCFPCRITKILGVNPFDVWGVALYAIITRSSDLSQVFHLSLSVHLMMFSIIWFMRHAIHHKCTLHTQHLLQLCNDMSSEFSSIVTMYPHWYTLVSNPSGYNTICNSFCLMVWKGTSLCPLRVVINHR